VFERKWILAVAALSLVVMYFLLSDTVVFAPDHSTGNATGPTASESGPNKRAGDSGNVQTGALRETYVLNARIVEVTDGDTLQIRGNANDKQRVRLASIDAPERTTGQDRPGQPFAEESRQFLAGQVLGRSLALTCYEQDRYGRHICDVPASDRPGTTVNQALVAAGLAWVNMEGKGRFMRDESMPGLQADAQSEKLGIWSEREARAPWVWRYQCWRNGQCQ